MYIKPTQVMQFLSNSLRAWFEVDAIIIFILFFNKLYFARVILKYHRFYQICMQLYLIGKKAVPTCSF